MSNLGLNEQEIGKMNSTVITKERVSTSHRVNLKEKYGTVNNTLMDYIPTLEI